MAPGPSFYIVYNLIYLLFIIITPLVTFHCFIMQLTDLFYVRLERLTTFPPLGAKYFGWVCAGPHLLKVKRQRSSTFTSLLISKSYWFDKPRFLNWGKTATIYNSAFAWGTTQLCQCLLIPTIRSLARCVLRLFGKTSRLTYMWEVMADWTTIIESFNQLSFRVYLSFYLYPCIMHLILS